MANVLVEESSLQAIADAIRMKNGSQSTYKPGQMANAIETIPTGSTPTGTKQISITANGTTTEDVSAYENAEITVNVQSADNTAKLVNGTITEFSDETITYVKDYAFFGCTRLTAVNIPNVTTIKVSSFNGCTNLTSFSGHKISQIQYGGQYAFQKCSNLEKIALPLLNDVNANTFNGCSKLQKVDVLGQYIRASAFVNCTLLDTLVLRKTTVSELNNVNALNGTPFASGGTGGTLYVPSDLISGYQSASNWSTILGYANNQILPIEGSIYETEYADGTAI